MNEIILIGEVNRKIIESNKNNITTIYIEIKNEDKNKTDYIPVCFRCIDHNLIFSLIGRHIAISGHVETDAFNRIFVDVINVIK